MVGLIPLFAVETLELRALRPAARLQAAHAVVHREPARASPQHVETQTTADGKVRRFLSLVDRDRLRRSPAGTCSTRASSSRRTASARSRASTASIRTSSTSTGRSTGSTTSRPSPRPSLFGGNSNWRGPVWFPVNFLIIESLQKFHYYLGDDFKVECPTGSGRSCTLWEVAAELSRAADRASSCATTEGRRPVFGGTRDAPERSALARPHAVLRVLPRRQRGRPRRQPPDRLDRPRRQADPAERRVGRGGKAMKAIAVIPGKPNSIHLARCSPPVARRGPGRPRRPRQGPARRRRRHRQGDQRRRVRRPSAGLDFLDHRPRGLRPGRGGRPDGHRAVRRLRRRHGAAPGSEPLRRDRPAGHDDRRRRTSSAASTCATAT